MGNRRRKDKAHDIGDSMPGTYGDSQGTIHDRQGGGPTFNPEDDVIVPGEIHEQFNKEKPSSNNPNPDADTEEQDEISKRMRYAKRYGDSWPEDRKRRFLREHDVSAEKMGWKVTE
ncbi:MULTISPECIES: hypothetical protein [Haloferax]|uniref:Uncharacterized protein n=2 Tax=Haloferax TaxID=2251 RepID=A0A6G1Z7Q2_9EURY|nr:MULTISPECIES: hypothetical protein [Haloferax]KAB1184816.1 hypothetical protein Hfx1149_17285 [Haloferax sp. CBA1149]MRW82448.1 hypothetical protein [Haloferax marinisediminis]